MKRCPQCEFIYEDDQSLCDMDGVLLVFDSRTLPNVHALATVSAPVPEKTGRRSRMVPAFATLLLMLAVASVYYVSTMRNAAQTDFSPASVTSTTAEAPVVVPPAPADDSNQAQVPAAEPTPQANEPATEAPAEAPAGKQPRATHSSPAVANPAPAPARKATTTTKPAEPKKDDSKVESILKKTGKILKKPFKF
jgi:hypothetical protein